MSKYIEKSTMKQYIRNFCKGLIADNRRFDPVDDCMLLCDVVNFAPAADVVEVIRCKEDCKHWQNSGSKMGESFDNMQYVGGCEWSCFRRFENDFCSYGEKKNVDRE